MRHSVKWPSAAGTVRAASVAGISWKDSGSSCPDYFDMNSHVFLLVPHSSRFFCFLLAVDLFFSFFLFFFSRFPLTPPSPHPPTLRLVASRLRSQSIIHPNSNPLEIARRGCKYLQTSDVEFAVQVDVDDWLIINQTIESIKKENRSEMLKLLVKMN